MPAVWREHAGPAAHPVQGKTALPVVGQADGVMYVFLGLNGYRIEATEAAVVALMLGVDEGCVEEEELADWLGAHLQPR